MKSFLKLRYTLIPRRCWWHPINSTFLLHYVNAFTPELFIGMSLWLEVSWLRLRLTLLKRAETCCQNFTVYSSNMGMKHSLEYTDMLISL